MFFHDLTYSVLASFNLSCCFKFGSYAAYSIAPAVLLKNTDDLLLHLLIVGNCDGLLILLPAVISTAADPEHPAQHLYRIEVRMQLNKAV